MPNCLCHYVALPFCALAALIGMTFHTQQCRRGDLPPDGDPSFAHLSAVLKQVSPALAL